MPKSSRMQKVYPWLVAAFVLLPALVAWQLQRTQHARDLDRFRQLIREETPRLIDGASVPQDIANRVMTTIARESPYYDQPALENALGEWRQQAPAALGYGAAAWADGKLVLVRQTLRESAAPRVEVGADLLALPGLREAWEEMLRGTPGVTSQPVVWLTDNSRPLVLVLRIAFAPGMPPTGEAKRRDNAIGAAFCLIDTDAIWDAGAAKIDRRLLTVERRPADTPVEKHDFDRTVGVGIGSGYAWKARFTPGPEFFPRQSWRTPVLVSAVGLLLAAFTFALARAQARQRAAVEELNETLDARVAALTEQLREENAQLRAAQAETERALAREQESGELKSRVVATISHEFRTPLSVILSSAEILRNYSDRLDPAQRSEQLKSIEDSVAGMSSLIQSVLAFSKAGAGRMEFRPERQAPGDLMREVIDEVLSASSRRCPIEFEGRQLDEPGWIDATLFRLILVNLLGNAVKYSPGGSPVELRALRAGDDLIFAVADRGIGIPEEDQKTLFQSFRRGRNTHGIPGTGLGLNIVKTCVELHRGVITVHSSRDVGSTFTVTLPIYVEPPPRSASTAPFPAPPASASAQPPTS